MSSLGGVKMYTNLIIVLFKLLIILMIIFLIMKSY